jgi:cytochrome c peroxidase
MKPLVIALALLLTTTCALAVEVATKELGKQLFEATHLGSNGKSCSSCHPQGTGLEGIGAYDDGTLKETINFCIRDALKGKMIDPESIELGSLLSYLRSLQPKP